MVYRYTEKELELIKKRQAVNLSNFERNSGRGLPPETVRAMEEAQGLKLNSDGAAIPRKLKLKRVLDPVDAAPPADPKGGKGRKKSARKVIGIIRQNPKGGFTVGTKAIAPAIARHRKRAECDGILFDSQLEVRRYQELKLLKSAGKILYFLRQVPFHLPGGIQARIDFAVAYPHFTQDGERTEWIYMEYEDCKAPQNKRTKAMYNDHDRVALNKRKQIKALYGVEVKLVTKAGRR